MLIDSSGCIRVENTSHCQCLLIKKMTMVVKKRLIYKECAKKGKMRKNGRERRLQRRMEEWMAGRVAKGIKRRGKVWRGKVRKGE